MPALGHEQICGFDVAVDDALGMSRRQRVGNLDGHLEEMLQFHRAIPDTVLQRLPIKKFHSDKASAILFANFVDRANVGMVQRRRGASFTTEAFQSLRVFRKKIR